MKRFLYLLLLIFTMAFITACGSEEKDNTNENPVIEENSNDIVIGFSQLGAESDWRTANTASMLSAFAEGSGYKLIFSDGQQKQANQIKAIRTFIQQEVDYIVLAPVIETGWDTVLEEAKEASIPVIIIDRTVDVKDDSLFTCWIGEDFELEGKKATEWLRRYSEAKEIAPEDIHIASIQGDLGSSAQLGRTKALEEAVEKNGWDLLSEVPGDFNQAKGREVMETFLREYDNLNVIYCENDNEALGALEAIYAAGKKPGTDILNGEILVISFDGVSKEALDKVKTGEIACIAECNPYHGPIVKERIDALRKNPNNTGDKYVKVGGDVFVLDGLVKSIEIDGFTYTLNNYGNLPIEEKTEE